MWLIARDSLQNPRWAPAALGDSELATVWTAEAQLHRFPAREPVISQLDPHPELTNGGSAVAENVSYAHVLASGKVWWLADLRVRLGFEPTCPSGLPVLQHGVRTVLEPNELTIVYVKDLATCSVHW